jgi:hypothetical protein
LWATVLAASAGHLLFGIYLVLVPLVANRSLGGAGAWTTIATSFGVGSLASGLLALRIEPARPLVTTAFGISLFMVPAACLAVAAPTALTALAAAVAGAGVMLGQSVWETALQRNVPEEALSRVSSYEGLGSYALEPVGLALAGPLAATVGAGVTLWSAFAIQLAAACGMLAVGDVRRLGGTGHVANARALAG